MHHLLEIVVVLLVALIIGWLIGWFLRCVLFRGAGQQRGLHGDGRGKLGMLEGGAAAGAAAAGGAMALASTSASAADAGTAGKGAAGRSQAGDSAASASAPAFTASLASTAATAAKEQDEGTDKADASAQAAESKAAEQAAEEMPAHGLSAPIGGKADDLQMISGIGPKLEKMLHEQGIYHFSQIASWTKKDIEEINDKLKFKGRIEREEWVRQAKLLAAGKMDQFEEEYGTGGKKGADGKTRSGSRTRKAGEATRSADGATARGKAASGGSGKGSTGSKGAGKKQEAPAAYGLSAPIGGKADDLQMISGIGPKLEKMLHDLGIYHFSQIASWTKKDIEEIDDKLKFKGRIEREEWVRQAKLLAAGKMDQFEKEYGTGGKKGADGKTRSGTRTRRK